MQPGRTQFSGQIFRLRGSASLSDALDVLRPSTGRQPIEDCKWRYFWIKSAKLLIRDENKARASTSTGYEYPFLIRESADRFVVMSTDDELIEHMIREAGLQGRLQKPRVDIQALVNDLAFRQGGAPTAERSYLMSAVWAAVEGQGRSLRSMSFFGDDLADAPLFRQALDSVNPFRVALRDSKFESEILNVSGSGEINLYFRNGPQLVAVDEALRFMTTAGYISW